MMTTMITGAGLVGSLAAARLLAEGEERPVLYDVAFSMENLAERLPLDRVTLVRGDVNDLPDLVRTMQTHGVDRVIHTAGFLTWMVRERPYAGVRVNLMGLLSVLEAARLTAVDRVVFCSSSTVYLGATQRPPSGRLEENFTLQAVRDHPPSVYASMKLAGEWLGHNYREEYGVECASVRFAGVFGPWHGTPSGGPSQLMKNLIESAAQGRPCRISSGALASAAIDYVYASDAAQGAVRAAQAPKLESWVYNVGMGAIYKVPELVANVERVAGRKLELDVFEARSPSGYSTDSFPTDLSRSRAELGYDPEYPMDEAIRNYLDWLERGASRR
jgi:UDP-glucose 4-epimerase